MTVPKRRHSASRQGKRRANWKLKPLTVVECPKCHEPVLPHYACPSCGTYHGREVIQIKEKKEKAKEKATEKKGKEKNEKSKEKKKKK